MIREIVGNLLSLHLHSIALPVHNHTIIQVLSVTNDVDESLNMTVEGEESGDGENSWVYIVYDNSWDENFKVDFFRHCCGCGQF